MAGIEENPFAALLAAEKSAPQKGINNILIEEVLLFTLSKTDAVRTRNIPKDGLISLADVVVADSSNVISEELLGHCLFERLLLAEPSLYIFPNVAGSTCEAVEKKAIVYLSNAFKKCEHYKNDHPEDCSKIKNLLLTNASTCVRQPTLFPSQNFPKQWSQLLQQSDEIDISAQEFLVVTVLRVLADDEPLEAIGALKGVFYPILSDLQKELLGANLITIDKNVYWTLGFLVRNKRTPQLAELLVDYSTPNPDSRGGDYMNTLFGQLFSVSIMPKNQNSPYEYFRDFNMATQSDPSLWQLMANHQNCVFAIIKQLLVVSKASKKKTLQWIANCLDANKGRGHLWNNLSGNNEQILHHNASDAFMTGLCAILMRISVPLCEPVLKVVLVDPTYCGVEDSDRQAKEVHMLKAFEETCLVPFENGKKRLTAETYNFVTEIFYMTHKAFELGNRACMERLTRMMRELQNTQTALQDVTNTDPNNELAKNLMRMLKDQMQQYLCIRNGLTEPENDTNILKFFEASAIWLTEIVQSPREYFETQLEKKNFAPTRRLNFEIYEPPFIAPYMASVPESLIDNICAYLNFSRHLTEGQFIDFYPSSHDEFFKMIILFMGSSELVKNPHLRAKLAEALEFFLPPDIEGNLRNNFTTQVFERHPDRLQVVNSLLNVFVSIEMTGQSVQFEQKFNYRRPMYAIMEYLWTIEEQVDCFKELASLAEESMEDITPPIFLRFINLLINDAIFLLDESLSNLQQIRQLQQAQDSGEWNSLTATERQQQLSNLHHLGMLARFDNILGHDTINILKLLTSEIKSIFCHSSMVDRIAAMLNYFLLNLVGPQKERFKVKDKKEFEFDPAQTVLEICHIYINLSTDKSFCLAVSQDGRSYSSQLFTYAENILVRIGGGPLIGELSEFAKVVKEMEIKYKEEQEFLVDAPDEYLDPIMSTLMTDPVMLPSSKVTVDRSTIARHLLSDQTDPFNREPLTMDKIRPNVALKTEIEKWMDEKRSASRLSS